MEQTYGVSPTRVIYSCLLSSCVKNKDISRGLGLLHFLENGGNWHTPGGGKAGGGAYHVSPDAEMYCSMIHGCLQHREEEAAVGLAYKVCQLSKPGDGRKGGAPMPEYQTNRSRRGESESIKTEALTELFCTLGSSDKAYLQDKGKELLEWVRNGAHADETGLATFEQALKDSSSV